MTDELMALLPCPFCGGAPSMEPWHGGAPTKMMVACPSEETGCEVGPMVTGETPAEAIAAWNRRTDVAASRVASGSTEELQALLAKATPGEWQTHTDHRGFETILCDDPNDGDCCYLIATMPPGERQNTPAIVAAVNWCRAELPALIAEVERLREALAKATKPSFYWDSEDSENGCDDLTVIMDNHHLGYVARLQCAATLPDQWAVGFVNEAGGFEAVAFATEAEAVAFSEARAALGASHDAK